MGKLHELLSVEPDLKGAAEKITKETVNTFVKKQAHFQAQDRSYQPVDEEGDTFESEHQQMVTTVPKKLDHTKQVVSKYLDAVAQKETTNTEACAEVIIDGVSVFGQPLPATLLLSLEGRLRQLREVYNAIPTLDPSESWKWDDATDTWEAKPRTTYKTKKVFRNHILAEATEKHPAQVNTYTEDERIGAWTTKKWNGSVTPAQKAELLARFDELAQAVKQARQRANDIEAKNIKIGEQIFDFVNAPLKR